MTQATPTLHSNPSPTHEDCGHFVLVRRDGTVDVYQLAGRVDEPIRVVRCALCSHLSGHELPFTGRPAVICRVGRFRTEGGDFFACETTDLFSPGRNLARAAAECDGFEPLDGTV